MVEASQTPKITLRARTAKVIRDCFTERDNATFDFVRIFGAGGILWFMGTETYAVAIKSQPFDPAAVATGLAALIAAVGAGVAVRAWSKSENGGAQ